MDAAPTLLDSPAQARVIGLPALGATAVGTIGMEVAKSGRRTGVTYGRVIDIREATRIRGHVVSYPRCLAIRGIANQDFSQEGDSGSLAIDWESKSALGLVFGALEDFLDDTYANLLDLVLAAFPNQILVQPGRASGRSTRSRGLRRSRAS